MQSKQQEFGKRMPTRTRFIIIR